MNDIKPAFPTIPEADRTPLVDALLELLAWYMTRVEGLEQEILKLKGETTKPKIKPSKMDDDDDNSSTAKKSERAPKAIPAKPPHSKLMKPSQLSLKMSRRAVVSKVIAKSWYKI
jgi:hypothetical protein